MIETIIPDWPAPANVHARVTTRYGGVSQAPWDDFNLADHVGDDPLHVLANRGRLQCLLPSAPVWLRQVHGVRCVDASTATRDQEADAAFSRNTGVVCAVLTADCLPIFICDSGGTVVAAVHAGWRGLAAGVIESAVAAMAGDDLMAWIGPAIGPQAFEVGDDVRAAFVETNPAAAEAFLAGRQQGKWMCDLYLLARQRLAGCGVRRITSADFCTFSDPERFFSYRRDGRTGRMASLIWLE